MSSPLSTDVTLVEIEPVASTPHVAELRLNRPEARNALSIDLCDAITRALGEVDKSDARAIVVTGAGKTFCAGADFSAVSGPAALDFLPAFERMLESIARHRLPIVAAIHGGALGGGLQLATVCDFRVAASDATFGIPSSRLGIVINFENVRRLVHLVGVAAAKQVLLTARTYDGRQAQDAGLVTDMIEAGPDPAAAVRNAAVDMASGIAHLAPLAVQGAKRSIQEVVDHMSAEPSDDVRALVAEAYGSRDLQEGLAAMAEKRDPNFRGS